MHYIVPKRQANLNQVFSVLFTEAAGSTVTAYNDSISRIIYGELAHSQIRRFVVVRQKHEFCFAWYVSKPSP
jgi:hypothetical protein